MILLCGYATRAAAQPPRPQVRPVYDRARTLAIKGQLVEAVAGLRDVVKQDPMLLEARNDLAWVLATSDDPKVRNPQEAVDVAEHLVDDVIRSYALRRQLMPNADPANPYAGLPQPPHFYKVTILRTLAAAYAAAGRFDAPPAPAQPQPPTRPTPPIGRPGTAATTALARAAAGAQGLCAEPFAVPYAQLATEAAARELRKRPNPQTRALAAEARRDVQQYRQKTAKRLAKPLM